MLKSVTLCLRETGWSNSNGGTISRERLPALGGNRQATISTRHKDRKWVGADLKPFGVSQRCQGQQTSVSIQHLPLLLSLHSLRSSTQHCHKTTTTQYRERKTHTRHIRLCVFEDLHVCECTQTCSKARMKAYMRTHTGIHTCMDTVFFFFFTSKVAFHAIKLNSPQKKVLTLCTVHRSGMNGFTVSSHFKQCDKFIFSPIQCFNVIFTFKMKRRVVVYIHPVTDKSVKVRATRVTRKEATLWAGELPTDKQ